MRARTASLVRSTVALPLPKDSAPENVAYDPETGAFYAGSMYKAKSGSISRPARSQLRAFDGKRGSARDRTGGSQAS